MSKYIIYGISDCSYCVKVITKLIEAKKCFYVEMLDDDPERLKHLKIKYDHPTVPIVVTVEEVEKLIGGCNDTISLIDEEKNDE